MRNKVLKWLIGQSATATGYPSVELPTAWGDQALLSRAFTLQLVGDFFLLPSYIIQCILYRFFFIDEQILYFYYSL